MPHSCDQRSAAKHVKLAKGVANAGLQRKHWRHGIKRSQSRRIGDHLRCLDRAKDRKAIKAHVATKRKALRLYRSYRRVAPYRGFGGEGRYLTWLPIPRYIVQCETNGYHGEGRWHARNPSGAGGPAQVMPFWGAPHPASSPAEKVRYWRITRGIWNSSGSGAWACA